MISVENLINSVCSLLTLDPTLDDTTVMCEFPNEKQDLPLRGPYITVGTDGIGINHSVESDSVCVGDSPCSVSLKLYACVPKLSGGNACYNLLDRMVSALSPFLTGHTVTSMNSGGISYSGSARCLLIPFTINVSVGNAY